MPHWLQLWITASLVVVWGIAILGGGSFLLATLTHAGESGFTPEQRSFLVLAYPHGAFPSASQYRWCDGRIWMFFDSRGDTWNYGQQCWRPDR